MQNIYIKTYFPKQRSVALTTTVGLILTLVYVLSGSNQASGATVGTGSCTQTVGSSTGVSVAVVNGNCVITFTNVGTTTWTVPTGVGAVRSLVVGGGGGAGGGGCNWMYGRGGGGGDVVDSGSTSVAVTAGATLSIRVGAGGVAAVSRTVGGVINSCADGLPYSVGSTGGQGGSSQFGTATAVIGGYSSPATTSAGGTSGNGNIGSGSAGAANTLNSWSGGGGGGAGGVGTNSGSGSNWACGGGLFGNGGPGKFSDISTGSLIGHGGGGAGAGCSGNGSATSGGGTSSVAVNGGGSYGGGGSGSNSGGSGVVILSYDPTCVVDAGYTNCQLFSYSGSNQSFTFPSNISGTQEILVELWGAGGGGTDLYWSGDQGGAAGGFSKATISATAGEQLTVVVGQGGLTLDSTVQYGGGGPGGTGGSTKIGSSGGGYSGIFSGAGTTTPIIISGGGGGASPGSPLASEAGPGGGGGANQSGGAGTSSLISGRGGTVSAGGAGATGRPTCTTTGSVSTSGTSLLGGSGCGQTAAEGGGGGGGGYFGGGGGTFQIDDGGTQNGGGGGGSGYLNTSRGTLVTAVAGANAVSSTPSTVATSFSYPDITSPRYANNAGRGGRAYTSTTADNSGGNGYITIQWKVGTSSAPGAPTIGTATATGGTTATVAFTAPASNGGAAITSYTATSSPAGGTGTLSQAGSGTISVTGLSAGVDYTFTVTATNSVGTSSPSAASNSITTTQPTATSGQLPSVLTVDPQSSSRYLPTTVNTAGPTNLLLCLNESDASGNNLASPTINFDVAVNGAPATTAGTGTSTIYGDRTTATYIYGVTANVITTLNSVLGTQIYLSSGAFSATKYIKIRAISIASSSSIGSKTCASTVYTSQNIEIRPLALERTMKKGTITLKQ
jgi:hypothetical protein